MKLTQEIKRILSALAYADVGENLTRRQKDSVLSNSHQIVGKPAVSKTEVSVAQAPRPQVALYLGGELAAEAMQYVMQTCARLRHGLTVMTFQSESDAQSLLAPYQDALATAGIKLRIVVLSGDPTASLARALNRRPEVAFLVCNEAGFFGHGLLNGAHSGMPVPVVLVAANERGAQQQVTRKEAGSAVLRAA